MKRIFVFFILVVLLLISPCVTLAESSWTFYYIQAAAPASCSVGELWFKSGAVAGSNWYGCTAANTWTLQGPSGLTVGTTSIASGINTRCLFDDNATLGEDAGCTYDKTTGVLTLAGRLIIPNGTAASPSIYFSGANAGTGIYSLGGENVVIAGNGTALLRTTGAGGMQLRSTMEFGWEAGAVGSGPNDLTLVRQGPAALQMGADAATPIAQTFKGPDGLGTNIAGGNLTVAGGNGTGSGAGGSLILSTTPAGASGSAQNTPVSAITIASTGLVTFNVGFNVSTLPTCNAGAKGSRAHVNDANAACTFVAAPVGGGSVVCPVFCNGTAWVEG